MTTDEILQGIREKLAHRTLGEVLEENGLDVGGVGMHAARVAAASRTEDPDARVLVAFTLGLVAGTEPQKIRYA